MNELRQKAEAVRKELSTVLFLEKITDDQKTEVRTLIDSFKTVQDDGLMQYMLNCDALYQSIVI